MNDKKIDQLTLVASIDNLSNEVKENTERLLSMYPKFSLGPLCTLSHVYCMDRKPTDEDCAHEKDVWMYMNDSEIPEEIFYYSESNKTWTAYYKLLPPSEKWKMNAI